MAVPFTALNRALKPFRNLLAARPVLATFQVNLRCNSACGYCDLPRNVGRYELNEKKSRGSFPLSIVTLCGFVLVQGGEPLLRRDLPEILEDVAFCERLIRVTTILLLSPPIITEARKFLKMGVWRSFLLVLLIILHVEFRLPALPRTFFQDAR